MPLRKPSELPVGTVARFVHARTADVILGRVVETGPDYVLVRPMRENGLVEARGLEPINDTKYIISEVYE